MLLLAVLFGGGQDNIKGWALTWVSINFYVLQIKNKTYLLGKILFYWMQI